MELTKRNIHMDRIGLKAETQFTLEDDVNLSDTKPDVTKILFTDGDVRIEDVRCMDGHILVKGKLNFHMLYESEDAFGQLFSTSGTLNFEETLNADGIESSDNPTVTAETENLSISLINSRKLSVQALILLSAVKEELYDEEVSVGIESDIPVEFQRVPTDFCGISVLKKDIFRIRAEQELPSNFPNVGELLWQDLHINDIEFKTPEGKITVRGDLGLFVLYRAESDGDGYQFYETTVPFSGSIDCYGCDETLIPHITYRISQKDLDIRPDLDGEERMLGIDLVLDLSIKLYVEETLEMIHDLYGVGGDIATQTQTGFRKKLLGRNHAKMRLATQISPENSGNAVMQLRHTAGDVYLDETHMTEDGIRVLGSLNLSSLYITEDDHFPYASVSYEVPFEYLIEIAEMTPDCRFYLHAMLEDLQVSMIGPDEFDVKALISFSALCYRDETVTLLSSVTEIAPDPEKANTLPGMTAYFVKEGDTLWQIGKEYYVPVQRLRDVNNLTSDTLKAGDKILVVR